MKTIKPQAITEAVSDLIVQAALIMRPDVKRALEKALRTEKSRHGREVLSVILENGKKARKNRVPICQDTGMAVVYCEVGTKVRVQGGLEEAITKGVIAGTKKGCLRRSIVSDPFLRKNTGTNTPVVIHYGWRKDNKIKLSLLLKGFGCENKSAVVMLNPTAEYATIKDAVLNVIRMAGPNACPPFVIGVGIGGTLDKAASMAKEVLFEPLGKRHTVAWCSRLERDLIKEANTLQIGPLGLGGTSTVLDVKVKTFPTHIAGLPVAVNVSCHATRSAEVVL